MNDIVITDDEDGLIVINPKVFDKFGGILWDPTANGINNTYEILSDQENLTSFDIEISDPFGSYEFWQKLHDFKIEPKELLEKIDKILDENK